MFRFANFDILYFLLLIPALVIIFIITGVARKKALKRFGEISTLSGLMPEYSKSRPVIKFIFLLLALTALIFAIARPQFGSKLMKTKRKGVEIIIALDVSNSMMAQDIQPNRLENAKRAIANLVNRLEDDKIGLIVFGGDAYVQVPVTTDYISAKIFLSTISPGIIPKQGTAIGAAINLAARSFSSESELKKALIIISDGENNEGDALEASKNAADKGIVIHTIGIGSPEGVPIPTGGESNFLKDHEGNTVISKLDEATLQQIAITGNGKYIRANSNASALNIIFDDINKMEKKEIDTRVYSEYEDQYRFLIVISLFLILLEFIVLERKNRRLMNINIFKI